MSLAPSLPPPPIISPPPSPNQGRPFRALLIQYNIIEHRYCVRDLSLSLHFPLFFSTHSSAYLPLHLPTSALECCMQLISMFRGLCMWD